MQREAMRRATNTEWSGLIARSGEYSNGNNHECRYESSFATKNGTASVLRLMLAQQQQQISDSRTGDWLSVVACSPCDDTRQWTEQRQQSGSGSSMCTRSYTCRCWYLSSRRCPRTRRQQQQLATDTDTDTGTGTVTVTETATTTTPSDNSSNNNSQQQCNKHLHKLCKLRNHKKKAWTEQTSGEIRWHNRNRFSKNSNSNDSNDNKTTPTTIINKQLYAHHQANVTSIIKSERDHHHHKYYGTHSLESNPLSRGVLSSSSSAKCYCYYHYHHHHQHYCCSARACLRPHYDYYKYYNYVGFGHDLRDHQTTTIDEDARECIDRTDLALCCNNKTTTTMCDQASINSQVHCCVKLFAHERLQQDLQPTVTSLQHSCTDRISNLSSIFSTQPCAEAAAAAAAAACNHNVCCLHMKRPPLQVMQQARQRQRHYCRRRPRPCSCHRLIGFNWNNCNLLLLLLKLLLLISCCMLTMINNCGHCQSSDSYNYNCKNFTYDVTFKDHIIYNQSATATGAAQQMHQQELLHQLQGTSFLELGSTDSKQNHNNSTGVQERLELKTNYKAIYQSQHNKLIRGAIQCNRHENATGQCPPDAFDTKPVVDNIIIDDNDDDGPRTLRESKTQTVAANSNYKLRPDYSNHDPIGNRVNVKGPSVSVHGNSDDERRLVGSKSTTTTAATSTNNSTTTTKQQQLENNRHRISARMISETTGYYELGVNNTAASSDSELQHTLEHHTSAIASTATGSDDVSESDTSAQPSDTGSSMNRSSSGDVDGSERVVSAQLASNSSSSNELMQQHQHQQQVTASVGVDQELVGVAPLDLKTLTMPGRASKSSAFSSNQPLALSQAQTNEQAAAANGGQGSDSNSGGGSGNNNANNNYNAALTTTTTTTTTPGTIIVPPSGVTMSERCADFTLGRPYDSISSAGISSNLGVGAGTNAAPVSGGGNGDSTWAGGGEFYSPGYPNNYPNSTDCVKRIEAPVGHYIVVEFRDQFAMEDSATCEYDKLEIRDGSYGYSKQLAQFCGDKFPPEVASSDRFMWLRFISDSSIEYPGFKAVYRFLKQPNAKPNPPQDCKFDVTKRTGIHSGIIRHDDIPQSVLNYTQTYNVSLECIWNITVLPGWNIYLTFNQYELVRPNDCESNFIEIYEELLREDKQTVKFCGTRTEPQTSKGNVFNIRHHADPRAYNQGDTQSKFEIIFTAFRDRGAGTCNSTTEFDCDDGTCIDASLKCDGMVNCKYRYDEAEDPGPCMNDEGVGFFDTEHMVIILVVFLTLVSGMCASIVVSCWGKIQERKRRKLEYQMRKSRSEASLDASAHSRVAPTPTLPNHAGAPITTAMGVAAGGAAANLQQLLVDNLDGATMPIYGTAQQAQQAQRASATQGQVPPSGGEHPVTAGQAPNMYGRLRNQASVASKSSAYGSASTLMLHQTPSGGINQQQQRQLAHQLSLQQQQQQQHNLVSPRTTGALRMARSPSAMAFTTAHEQQQQHQHLSAHQRALTLSAMHQRRQVAYKQQQQQQQQLYSQQQQQFVAQQLMQGHALSSSVNNCCQYRMTPTGGDTTSAQLAHQQRVLMQQRQLQQQQQQRRQQQQQRAAVDSASSYDDDATPSEAGGQPQHPPYYGRATPYFAMPPSAGPAAGSAGLVYPASSVPAGRHPAPNHSLSYPHACTLTHTGSVGVSTSGGVASFGEIGRAGSESPGLPPPPPPPSIAEVRAATSGGVVGNAAQVSGGGTGAVASSARPLGIGRRYDNEGGSRGQLHGVPDTTSMPPLGAMSMSMSQSTTTDVDDSDGAIECTCAHSLAATPRHQQQHLQQHHHQSLQHQVQLHHMSMQQQQSVGAHNTTVALINNHQLMSTNSGLGMTNGTNGNADDDGSGAFDDDDDDLNNLNNNNNKSSLEHNGLNKNGQDDDDSMSAVVVDGLDGHYADHNNMANNNRLQQQQSCVCATPTGTNNQRQQGQVGARAPLTHQLCSIESEMATSSGAATPPPMPPIVPAAVTTDRLSSRNNNSNGNTADTRRHSTSNNNNTHQAPPVS